MLSIPCAHRARYSLLPVACCLLFRRATLGALRPILRPSLVPPRHAHTIQRPAHHVIAHARQILHAAPANQHNRVLLQVVPNPRNISSYLNSVRQPHASHFPQRGIRLLRRLRIHARAYPAPLRRSLQCGRRRLVPWRRPSLFHQLIECRQTKLLLPPTIHNHSNSRTAHKPARSVRGPKSQPKPDSVRTKSRSASRPLFFPARREPATVTERAFSPRASRARGTADSVSKFRPA
jgi:hypothetical protein